MHRSPDHLGIIADVSRSATGTLFRSSKKQRVSTVGYIEVEQNKVEAVADYQVHANSLIQTGTLRLPQLYRMAAEAEVVDLHSAEVTTGELADPDAQKCKAVTRDMIKSRDWLSGFVAEALKLLEAPAAAALTCKAPPIWPALGLHRGSQGLLIEGVDGCAADEHEGDQGRLLRIWILICAPSPLLRPPDSVRRCRASAQ